MHWKSNLFYVPSGASGKQFVTELARLFQAYADASALEIVAILAAMIMPHILLQKPQGKSKAHEYSKCLSRRLQAWHEGKIEDLLKEARTIQRHLSNSSRTNGRPGTKDPGRRFAELMKRGNITSADRMLSEQSSSCLLSLHQ